MNWAPGLCCPCGISSREALLAEYRAAVAAGPLSAEVEALQSIKGCGFALAAAFASFDRNHLGGLVRKLVREDCLSPDKAKTLRELGYHRSPAVRGSLKRGSVLGNVVHCVEREQHEQEMQAARAAYIAATGSDSGFVPSPFRMDLDSAHFYIPDEQHYAAEVRFEKEGSGWRSFLLVLILSVVAASLVILFLPDILQLVDNMIGILKGDSKVLN